MQSLPIAKVPPLSQKPKVYKKKLKRHKDAVLALHSQDGFDGGILISGSSDHSIRIWDLMKQRIATKITVMRPTDEFLMKNNFQKPKSFNPQKQGEVPKNVCAYCFHGEFIFTGYEDGLICSWSLKKNGELSNALVGHENRVNFITATDGKQIFSASNDCTVRSWDVESGFNIGVYKFSDPVSNIAISMTNNIMYTASWDKMIRSVDLEVGKVTNAFQGATEAIKVMLITDTRIFVGGCDPIIRSWDLVSGECVQYQGHTGWVYCMKVYKNLLFSGGDDKTIRIWNVMSGKQMDELVYHENGVTCLQFALEDIFSGSYDHYIICWDLKEIEQRIHERELMREEDILSRKIEIYNRTIEARKGKKKKKKGKKGKKPKK